MNKSSYQRIIYVILIFLYFFIVKNKKIGGDMNGFLGMVKILVRIIKIQEK